jgi:hypothetical protein
MSSATAINDSASHIVHEATAGSDSDDWTCAKFVSELQSETSLLSSLINSRLGSAQAQMRAQLQTSWAKLLLKWLRRSMHQLPLVSLKLKMGLQPGCQCYGQLGNTQRPQDG